MHYKHRQFGNSDFLWPYRNAVGDVYFYIGRWDQRTADGKRRKEIRPITLWERPNGERRYRLKALSEPWPLYQEDELAARPDAEVIIVEGEKAADAAYKLCPNMIVTTWPGGTNATHKVDWDKLTGRDVTIWPDADDAGKMASIKVAHRLHGIAETVEFVELPTGLKCGWDLADAKAEGWTSETTEHYIKDHRRTFQPADVPEKHGGGEDIVAPSASTNAANTNEKWFTALGFAHDTYFYFSRRQQQVLSLPVNGANKPAMHYLGNGQHGYLERAGRCIAGAPRQVLA